MKDRLIRFLNPMKHLGERKYSLWFPLLTTLSTAAILEYVSNSILGNPDAVGMLAIVLFLALIIYFSFREGVGGGMISVVITLAYYLYIIYSHNYEAERYEAGIRTTFLLGLVYFLVAWIIGWLKQNLDVLIERESDERHRLRAIIQQLPVRVVITNSQGIVTQVNRQIEAIYGVRVPIGFDVKKDSLVEVADTDGKTITPANTPIYHSLQSGKVIVGKEFSLLRNDGKTIHIQVSSTPIRNKEGRMIAAASITADMTAQKEIERRKDDFVNMASHELKTPITSMKLYMDTLMNRIKKLDDERSVKILENVKGQTNRLQKLVNDLLDVSRLQTGKMSFSKEVFRLDELVAETVETLTDFARGQPVEVTRSSPVLVNADRFRIYQVVTNLVTNALKYSPGGKGVKIRIYRHDGKATVSVQDFGIGIAKDQQKKIFERLYQVTDDHEKTFPGFGMGLYISKEIIKRHKGSIWVESEKGKGSTFYFTLPL